MLVLRRTCVALSTLIGFYYVVTMAIHVIRPTPLRYLFPIVFLLVWSLVIAYWGWKAKRRYFWVTTIITAILAYFYPSPQYIVVLPFLVVASLTMVKQPDNLNKAI